MSDSDEQILDELIETHRQNGDDHKSAEVVLKAVRLRFEIREAKLNRLTPEQARKTFNEIVKKNGMQLELPLTS